MNNTETLAKLGTQDAGRRQPKQKKFEIRQIAKKWATMTLPKPEVSSGAREW